jgi:xylan 1,4-beta-xylosidase
MICLGSALAALFATSIAQAQTPATNSSHAAKTYRNPLMPDREIADPDVILVDGKYYLYPTSIGDGLEVFVSDDLVHWERKALAFDDPRGGDWAPEVFRNQRGDGKYYLYYTDSIAKGVNGLQKQIGVAMADGPLGPFADQSILAMHAIDPDPFQDADGALYLYCVDLDNGFKIVVLPMADPLHRKGEPTVLIRPTEPWEKISGRVTEGPFMVKHNRTYYLMFSGTGADSPNYGIGYATSTSPMGPFVKYAGNPIVHRGGNIFGPGHHCVIEGPDKHLWMLYHQKWDDGHNFHRFLALDPLWFDDQGVLHAKVSRDTDEPAP